mmetsp:Transcript_8491/g.16564  ORF Transcript_8491/g.16564 Transcript_8491/m.16564 type:complete len:322 (-) Transcript_8491:433-1398(-)
MTPARAPARCWANVAPSSSPFVSAYVCRVERNCFAYRKRIRMSRDACEANAPDVSAEGPGNLETRARVRRRNSLLATSTASISFFHLFLSSSNSFSISAHKDELLGPAHIPESTFHFSLSSMYPFLPSARAFSSSALANSTSKSRAFRGRKREGCSSRRASITRKNSHSRKKSALISSEPPPSPDRTGGRFTSRGSGMQGARNRFALFCLLRPIASLLAGGRLERSPKSSPPIPCVMPTTGRLRTFCLSLRMESLSSSVSSRASGSSARSPDHIRDNRPFPRTNSLPQETASCSWLPAPQFHAVAITAAPVASATFSRSSL